VTDNADTLFDYANEKRITLQNEEIKEYDINGKYHAK